MRMLQIFETTIFSDSSEHAIHAIVVPQRSFAGTDLVVNVDSIVAALGLQKLTLPTITASSLGPAFAVIASPTVPQTELTAHLMTALQVPVPAAVITPTIVTPLDRDFGELAAFDNLVPFELSPINLESIGKLVVSATGAGIGAYAGFVLAGPTPLLFVAIPAGMIICGAAKGIADALEQGLRQKRLQFLRSGAEPGIDTAKET